MPRTSTIAQTLRSAATRPRTSSPIPARRVQVLPSTTRTPLRPSPATVPTGASSSSSRPPGTSSPLRTRIGARGLSSMASDEDYMAFLNKANRDADAARAQTQAQAQGHESPFKALDEGAQVPRAIADAIRGAFYVSDADEPFHGVCLKWSGEGGLPDEEEFARLIRHWDAPHAEIEIMDPAEWDRHEQYGGIVGAVSEATRGNDVRVYRVPRDRSSRVEYWVVSRDDSAGSIVGVKALGVES